MGSGSRSTASSVAIEEYKPVVNTLPEVTQLLLGQERHCQGLLDVLQPDQTQGPQVVSLCGAPGAGDKPQLPAWSLHRTLCTACCLLHLPTASGYCLGLLVVHAACACHHHMQPLKRLCVNWPTACI